MSHIQEFSPWVSDSDTELFLDPAYFKYFEKYKPSNVCMCMFGLCLGIWLVRSCISAAT